MLVIDVTSCALSETQIYESRIALLRTKARAEAFAPASMGNVGVGFDILGLAFCEPGDIVRVECRDEPGVKMLSIEGDDGVLPLDPARNTAAVAVAALLQTVNAACGVGIHLKKGLPLASGLGSSAASAVAAVMATNALLGEPLSREELLPACLEGEALVSGYHADNVAPCLLGGITLTAGPDISQIQQLPVPPGIHLTLVTPKIAVPTIEARAVLPQSVPLKTMVAQTAAVARLVDALHRGDVAAMAAAMEQDEVIEPARAHLMPLLGEARAHAKHAGALGLVISGAGPTLCAVSNSPGVADQVRIAIQALYDEAGIGAVSRCTEINEIGARVLEVL
jgi:homoserine kinase